MKFRKQIQRILITGIILSLILSIPCMAIEGELPFHDVSGDDWYYEGVSYVYQNRIMAGTCDIAFAPEMTTTRGMIVTILHNMEGRPEAKKPHFDDVPIGKYYAPAVFWANEQGIVSGYSSRSFGPDDPVTRQQFVAILYRYVGWKGYSCDGAKSVDAFRDTAKIRAYAKPAMQWAYGNGFLTGMPDHTIAPDGKATRAQIAQIFMRFCEKYHVTVPERGGREPDGFFTFVSREGRVNGTPANSITGIEEAIKAGFTSIRVSVRMTKDRVWVLFHDETINDLARNPDGSEIKETIPVSQSTYEELNQYDYGIAYGKRFTGTKLSTLKEFLDLAAANNLEPLLEIKEPADEKQINELASLIQETGLEETVWISSYEMETLKRFSAVLPKANLAMIGHFSEDALQKLLKSGLITREHRTRLDCYYTDHFEESLIRKYYQNGLDIKVGSVYTIEQLHQFIDLRINYIEVANISDPWDYT